MFYFRQLPGLYPTAGVSVVSSRETGKFAVPAGAAGQYAMRLGFKFQQASLRKLTSYTIEPGVDYTVMVRAVASDDLLGDNAQQEFQLIARVDDQNILTKRCVATARWQPFNLVIPADILAEHLGQPIEIRFYKPALKEGAFVWLDDVQLWRGRIDSSNDAAEDHENPR